MEVVIAVAVVISGFIALIVAASFFDVWRWRKSRERMRLVWQGVADSVSGQLETEQKRHGLLYLPDHRLVGSLGDASFAMWVDRGEGENRRNTTQLEVRRAGTITEVLRTGTGLGTVKVARARAIGRLIRRAGAQDIATGNEEFDDSFLLVARRDEAAQRLFASSRLRAAVRDAMADGRGLLEISDSMISYSEDGELRDRARLRALINLFEVILKRLDQLSPRSGGDAASGESPTQTLIDF